MKTAFPITDLQAEVESDTTVADAFDQMGIAFEQNTI